MRIRFLNAFLVKFGFHLVFFLKLENFRFLKSVLDDPNWILVFAQHFMGFDALSQRKANVLVFFVESTDCEGKETINFFCVS